ncbi:MAG: YHS domain-containing protein [Bacteroidota bacterium]
MKNTKSFIPLFTPIILITLLTINVYAQQKKHDHNAVMKQDTASVIEQYKNIKDKEVREYMTNLHLEMIDKTKPTYKTWNTVCPVLGRPVNPKLKPIVYNGKTYGFCCKVCPPKFQENPEKYIKNLNKTGKKFIGKVE